MRFDEEKRGWAFAGAEGLERWGRAHEWPAQVVLVLGAVAIAAVVFVFGLLVGAGIAPWLGGG
jgi:hypothetical protein